MNVINKSIFVTMKTTVNERVGVLRNHFKLSFEEFAVKAGLTGSGIHRIEGGEVSPQKKTIRSIANAYGASENWLLTGQGSMLEEIKEIEASNPWKEIALNELKEEVTYLREMLKMALQGKKSFLNAVNKAGLNTEMYMFPNKSVSSVGVRAIS